MATPFALIAPGSVGVIGQDHGAFNPTALGSKLLEWFDARRVDLITKDGGSAVSSWKGSKNRYNPIQATGSFQPIWGATSFGGAPGITFDGTDDRLSLASVPFPTGANTSEIWALAQNDALVADTTGREICAYGGSASTTRRGIGRTVVSGINRGRVEVGDSSSSLTKTGTNVDFSTRSVIRAVINAASADVWVDGIFEGTVSCNMATGTLRWVIGASANTTVTGFWQGVISDVIVTQLLSTSEANALWRFLMARRNVAALPQNLFAAELSRTSASLGWHPFGTGTTQYVIFRDGVGISTRTDLTELSYDAVALTSGQLYNYKIAADTPTGRVWGGNVYIGALIPPLTYSSTFEQCEVDAAALISGWTKSLTSGQIQASTERARSGSKSIKFDFDFADVATNHHCQIVNPTNAPQDQYVWYGWSTYLDSYAPDDPANREIIWQLHGASGGPADGGPPPVASYLEAGEQQITVHGDATTVYASGDGPTGIVIATTQLADDVDKWVDYVQRVNFSYSTGSVDVWRKLSTESDWVKIATYTGPTLYHVVGQSGETGPFLDLGPYKFFWDTATTVISNRTMFVDEVRIGDSTATLADVAPR